MPTVGRRWRFDLSDDLTSWRVSASAVDTHLRAGDGIAPRCRSVCRSSPRRPSPRSTSPRITRSSALRGFGSALHAGDRGHVHGRPPPSLGLAPVTATAAAFEAAEVRAARPDHGRSRHPDHRLERQRIEPSRRRHPRPDDPRRDHAGPTQGHTVSAPLAGGYQPPSGVSGLTTVTVSDAGRGRVLPLLLALRRRRSRAEPIRRSPPHWPAACSREAFGLAPDRDRRRG